jgi:hypothetical protein
MAPTAGQDFRGWEAVLLNRSRHWLLVGAQTLSWLLLLTARAEATTAPVGWWKFDEGSGSSTSDSSGNGATGALTNTPTWVAGRILPGALSFNGSTQSVAISGAGAVANLYTTGMTVSAWIKPAGLGGGNGGRIVDKDNNDQGWYFSLNASNTLKFASDQFSGTSPSVTSASSAITLNAWQHVVATWDGTTSGAGIHLYVNGTLLTGTTVVTGANNTTTYPDPTTPFTIGNRPTDNARGFNGLIDDVRVYNRVLSAAEITALADSTAPTAPSGLTTGAAATSSQINFTWTGSTDAVGVTSYLVERCAGGSGCSSFSQVGTSTTASYSDLGLTASTTYSYRVRASDANTNYSGYSNTYIATTAASSPPPVPAAVSYSYDSLGRLRQASYDTGTTVAYTLDPAGNRTNVTTGPATPLNFAATATSTTQINLTWTAVPQATGYKLYRPGSTTPFTLTSTSYSDTGLTAYTTYSYAVAATYPSGALSGQATASARTLALPPNPPTSVSASAASQTSINVSWSGATDPSGPGIGQYGVYRDGTQITTTTGTSYTDTGLAGWSTHSYYIVTYDNSSPRLSSTPSSTASARTLDTTAPSTPTGFTATAVGNTQINLSWNGTTDTGGSGLVGYAIFTATDGNGHGTGIPYTTTATSYSLTGLTPGATYTYYLEAYDNAGNYSGYQQQSLTLPTILEHFVLTQGQSTYFSTYCNGYMFVQFTPGVGCPAGIGSISPMTLAGGQSVVVWYDQNGSTSYMRITGFSANPGQNWLIGATAVGVTKTGASASYGYNAGAASWSWTTAFGFGTGSFQNVTINHQ